MSYIEFFIRCYLGLCFLAMLCGKNRDDVVLLAREMFLLDRRQFCSDCFQQCNQPAGLAKNIFYYIILYNLLYFSLSRKDGVQDIVNIVNIVNLINIVNIVYHLVLEHVLCKVLIFFTTYFLLSFHWLPLKCNHLPDLAKTPVGMPEQGKRGHISPFSFHSTFSFSVFLPNKWYFLPKV